MNGNFVFSPDDAEQLWNNFHAVIYEFNGDAENLFSSYYGLLCDNFLSGKFDDITLSNILLTEVANDMLIHRSGSDVVDVGIPQSSYDLSEEDLKTLQYLAGFVVHKLYVKFRFNL